MLATRYILARVVVVESTRERVMTTGPGLKVTVTEPETTLWRAVRVTVPWTELTLRLAASRAVSTDAKVRTEGS